MKENKLMNKKENRGITLVALVITTIVLIILAGVSINAVINVDLITNSKNARNEYDKAKLEEETTLTDYELITHFSLNNSKYKCKYGFITGIELGELASNLVKSLPEGYSLYEIDIAASTLEIVGEEISKTDEETILKTGMAIKKDGKIVANVVIFGDITGEGIVDASDRGYLHAFIESNRNSRIFPNHESFDIAADVNHDGIIDSNDRDYLHDVITPADPDNPTVIIQNVEAKKITQTN